MVNVFSAFAMVFLAEMGDKTQLFLVSLSSKFKIKSIIIGVAAAIAVLNAAAVAVGFLIGDAVDPTIVKFVAGAAFLAFESKTGEARGFVFTDVTLFFRHACPRHCRRRSERRDTRRKGRPRTQCP